MYKCKFCGTELDEHIKFCSNCGAKVEPVQVVEGTACTNQGTAQSENSSCPAYTRRPMKYGMLIWSIANALFGLIGCCGCLPFVSMILGVISITLLVLAQDAKTDRDEKSKIRTSLILNIIASSILIISVVLIVVLIAASAAVSAPGSILNLDDFIRMYPYLD